MEEQNCKNCKKIFTPTKGLLNYCSLQCRNSRTFSTETNNKKSIAQKKFLASLPDETRDEYFTRRREIFMTNLHSENWYARIRETRLQKYLSKTWDELSKEQKRRRVIEEQNEKCIKCDLSHWQGIQLSLEIDHINGINSDNSRDNVCALCPNCHSITPTWRGRNKPTRNGDNKVSDAELIDALVTTSNIRQALLKVGLAAKGDNYPRAKKLLDNLEPKL